MGGIPFKSTGCNTCRRRKVKCDEAKPECLRCVKNGHVCAGYERQRVFIHKSSNVETTHQLQQRPNGTPASRRKQHAGASSSASSSASASASASAGAEALVVASGHNGPLNINLNTINSRSVPRFDARPEIRSQLLSSFIDTYLPPTQYLPNANLFQMLPGLVGGSPLLDKAIASLSSAFIATQNKDDQLLRYSTKLYSNTMENLQGKIKMGKSLGKDLLYTTMIFQVYELINCSPSGFPAWLAHVQGSNAIIRQCDSRNQANRAENLFLRQLRYVILCDAIGKRKAASHYSIPILPKISPESTFQPEPMDEFIDILVECSSLIEQVDQLLEFEQGGPVSSRRSGERLLRACLSLENKLHNACIDMQDKLGIPSPLPKDAHVLNEFRAAIPMDFFAEPLGFPSLTCAESHMMYWTTLVLLNPLIDQLFNFLGPSTSMPISTSECYPSVESESEHGHRRTGNFPTTNIISPKPDDFFALADIYATEICRSVAYILQPDMKSLGAQMLLAPLSQATQFFQVQQAVEKVHWCQAVFMTLPKMGLRIGPFLKDMVWPQYRLSQKRRSPTPPEQDERHELIVPLY